MSEDATEEEVKQFLAAHLVVTADWDHLDPRWPALMDMLRQANYWGRSQARRGIVDE